MVKTPALLVEPGNQSRTTPGVERAQHHLRCCVGDLEEERDRELVTDHRRELKDRLRISGQRLDTGVDRLFQRQRDRRDPIMEVDRAQRFDVEGVPTGRSVQRTGVCVAHRAPCDMGGQQGGVLDAQPIE